jgi:predicted RNA binding protein YcfA (HicA-like mRNA interferase family)
VEAAPEKRIQRLLEAVAANLKNCAFDDLKRLLEAVGFTHRTTKSSHHIFKLGRHAISVPFRRPVKENYVREALALVEVVLKEGQR